MPLPIAILFGLSSFTQFLMMCIVARVLRQRGRKGVVWMTVAAAFVCVCVAQTAAIAGFVLSWTTIAKGWEITALLVLVLVSQSVAMGLAWREREPVSLAFVGAILTALIMLPVVMLLAAFWPNALRPPIGDLALVAGICVTWHLLTWALILHWARRIPTPVGICHRCGYELGELRRSTCPECGELVD